MCDDLIQIHICLLQDGRGEGFSLQQDLFVLLNRCRMPASAPGFQHSQDFTAALQSLPWAAADCSFGAVAFAKVVRRAFHENGHSQHQRCKPSPKP